MMNRRNLVVAGVPSRFQDQQNRYPAIAKQVSRLVRGGYLSITSRSEKETSTPLILHICCSDSSEMRIFSIGDEYDTCSFVKPIAVTQPDAIQFLTVRDDRE